MSNEEVVANALRMSDTPNEDGFSIDDENAQLLKLFEEGDDDYQEDASLDVDSEEDGREDEPDETAAADSTDKASAEEPEPKPDSATSTPEDAAGEETPQLQIPEAEAKPRAPTSSPEERAKWRADALAKIEEHYASQVASDEIRDQLLTEPEKALPKILANAYMDMYDSLLGGVGQTLPSQVQQVMQAQRKAQEYETQFFTEWPQLQEAYNDNEKQQVIQRAVHSYRQMNPKAPVEQAIKEAGAMAMVALRIPLTEQGAGKTSSPPQTKGFSPASPGGGAERSSPPPAPKQLNEYEQLAQELIDDGEV